MPDGAEPCEAYRQLDRKLNAALICAGVASQERGEWAAQQTELWKAITDAFFMACEVNGYASSMGGVHGHHIAEQVRCIKERLEPFVTPTRERE